MSLTNKLLFLPIGVLLLAAPEYADDNSCKAVFDASNKVIVTPAHLYTTRTSGPGNKTKNNEMIYSGGAGGVIYILIDGKWTRSRMTGGEMLKIEEENRTTQKATCQFLRDESVNGEAATVYSGRAQGEDSNTTTTMWISKRSGLPLRQDVDIDMGGVAGKGHQSTRYEYTNVRPPAGVQ